MTMLTIAAHIIAVEEIAPLAIKIYNDWPKVRRRSIDGSPQTRKPGSHLPGFFNLVATTISRSP